MPIALVVALATSLAAHSLLLLLPEIELATFSEPPPLVAELKPPPASEVPLESPPEPARALDGKRPAKRPARAAALPPREPVLQFPGAAEMPPNASPEPAGEGGAEPASEALDRTDLTQSPTAASAAIPSRLPARGLIRYRVDRGDQGFMIGQSTHDWAIVDGAYRITAITETNGLVALFKPFRIELESRGTLTARGLVPERFSTRRKGRATGEQADFDWTRMRVQVGKHPPQALSHGAQDLLSFRYQLGLLTDPGGGSLMPVATGKKYEHYRFEALGDDDVSTPAGSFRSLHLRVAGDAPTELWLAYDRSLLPVRIVHTDHQGAVFVETATAIELSQEP